MFGVWGVGCSVWGVESWLKTLGADRALASVSSVAMLGLAFRCWSRV